MSSHTSRLKLRYTCQWEANPCEEQPNPGPKDLCPHREKEGQERLREKAGQREEKREREREEEGIERYCRAIPNKRHG